LNCKERNLYHIVDEVYAKCKSTRKFKNNDVMNYVTAVYAPFEAPKRFQDKIAEMLEFIRNKAEVKSAQTVEDFI
jgi:amidophosphoribosyltransferase